MCLGSSAQLRPGIFLGEYSAKILLSHFSSEMHIVAPSGKLLWSKNTATFALVMNSPLKKYSTSIHEGS